MDLRPLVPFSWILTLALLLPGRPAAEVRSEGESGAPLAALAATALPALPAPAASPAPASTIPSPHPPGEGPAASAAVAEEGAGISGPAAEPRPQEELPSNGALPAEDAAETAEAPSGVMARIDEIFGRFNGYIAGVLFFDVWFWDDGVVLPFAVLWLVAGATFFTLRMGFINLRGFRHAIDVTRGKYDDPSDEGEVTHFQALSAALSATVGLGNIAGVAIAVSQGGPGATFWMILAGLLGMSSKFTECTLGQMYRETRPDGRVMGGAMFYLSKGLRELGLGRLGAFLAVFFAILCIGGSLAGGNAFQVNQSLNALQLTFPFLIEYNWVYGLLMTALVGVVIIGGIKRIAGAASAIVPLMCVVYVIACIVIILDNASHIPGAFGSILSGAFTAEGIQGGFLGVLVIGFQRAAFSNEAGVGSAAIAHSAAKTDYPVREGIVSLLEPFIDTVVICTMTALVIVISGAYENPAYQEYRDADQGAALTSMAMGEHLSFMPYVLGVAVFLFAFSTMISWSYYGERCWAWMFGDGSSMAYRWLFLVFVFLGSIVSATNALEFGDLMILGMAVPNVLGVVLLSGKVRRALDDYWGKRQRGEL